MSTLSALVTGASRGIGRAVAHALAARGCQIAVHCHRDEQGAEATRASLGGAGHHITVADLADDAGIARLWADVTRAFGTIDIVVNNAGIYDYHPPLTTSYAEWRDAWDRTLRTNLIGPANLCHFAANAMASRGDRPGVPRGRIVNISSRGAFRGEPMAPAYGASKAGLNALSQSLAKALAPAGVHVFCVAPGWVETDMAAPHIHGPRRAEILEQMPLGRVATPAEVAQVVAFCALDAPASMTGSIVDVNGASYLRT